MSIMVPVIGPVFREQHSMSDRLELGSLSLESRLILGTGKFPDVDTMLAAVKASGTQLVTVALRRFNGSQIL